MYLKNRLLDGIFTFFVIAGLRELNCFEGPVEVKKIENIPLPAKLVTLKLIKPEMMSETQIIEITQMLSMSFNSRVIINGQFLVVNFYGLKPKFKVLKFRVHYSSMCLFFCKRTFISGCERVITSDIQGSYGQFER